jgi:hypothetical protein
LFKGFDVFGLEVNLNVDDEHNQDVKTLKRWSVKTASIILCGKGIRVCSVAQAFGERRARGSLIAFGEVLKLFENTFTGV